jgi:hypothetical protein
VSSDRSSRRWRLTVAWAPVAGLLSLLLMDVLLMVTREVTVFGVVLGVLALLGLLGAAASARLLLAQERQVTAGTTARYRALRDLLAVAEQPVVPPGGDVLIVPLSDQREFHRFDRDEFTSALTGGTGEPVVYERFTLLDMRPVVLHQFGAITLTADRKVGSPFHDAPRSFRSPRTWWLAVKAARLSSRTGADIATDAELDTLISQLQLATR